jgi:hypothetical protein
MEQSGDKKYGHCRRKKQLVDVIVSLFSINMTSKSKGHHPERDKIHSAQISHKAKKNMYLATKNL